MLRPFVWMLCLLVSSALCAGATDDELVDEFRKHYRSLSDPASRVEAVLSLEGSEGVEVVEVLVPLLDTDEPQLLEATLRVLAGLDGAAERAALFARLAAERSEPRRIGLLRVVARGAWVPEDPPALHAFLTHRSAEVRRRAVQAVAAGGGEGAVPALLERVADSDPGVRAAALEGLAALRAPEVVDVAIAALADPVWQVRVSAIEALGQVRARRSIPALIERMALEEGRLVADIGDALGELTTRDLGAELAAWQRFWETFGERFELPSDEQVAALRASQAASRARYQPAGAVQFHGIDTPSRRIVFVIDVSGSMEAEVVERDRFRDGGYPSFQRMDIVKTELARTIERLEPYVEFNVVSFATEVSTWKKRPVRANVINKRSALEHVGRLAPLGGSSKQDLSAVGLVGASDLWAGRTNTFGALMQALGVETHRGARRPVQGWEVDTVFFLSDGRPTAGEFIEPRDIRREVLLENEQRKVVIHTIAIGEFQKEFMRQLALENGGIYVDLGM